MLEHVYFPHDVSVTSTGAFTSDLYTYISWTKHINISVQSVNQNLPTPPRSLAYYLKLNAGPGSSFHPQLTLLPQALTLQVSQNVRRSYLGVRRSYLGIRRQNALYLHTYHQEPPHIIIKLRKITPTEILQGKLLAWRQMKVM